MSTPLPNTNLLYAPNNLHPTNITKLPQTCKKYGDQWIYPDMRDVSMESLNVTHFPTSYTSSIADIVREPGLHVWMIFEDGTFAAARTFSTYEILSKHQDLYMRATRGGPKRVVAAGEARVGTDGSVTYNFQSGTFMVPILATFVKKYTDANMRNAYRPWMTHVWLQGGATSVTYVDASMIHDEELPLEEAILRSYNRGGVPFRAFATEEACKKHVDYYSGIGEARRTATRRTYDSHVATMTRYGRPVPPFEDWLKEQRREKLFEVPAQGTVLFRGGARTRKARRRNRRAYSRKYRLSG